MIEQTHTTAKTRRVLIRSIRLDRKFQVRVRGIDLQTVKRYATILLANPQGMPPVTLADVAGRLTCVDGWHRLEAHRRARLNYVMADVVPATETEALWMAARANLKNPRPLSKADLVQAFRMYVSAKRHRTPEGGFKSYREIAGDFSNVKAHTTIRNWMRSYYPAIAYQMRGGFDEDAETQQRQRGDDRARMQAVMHALEAAEAQIAALGPPRDRPEIVAALAEIARVAGLASTWSPGEADPF